MLLMFILASGITLLQRVEDLLACQYRSFQHPSDLLLSYIHSVTNGAVQDFQPIQVGIVEDDLPHEELLYDKHKVRCALRKGNVYAIHCFPYHEHKG